jgi:hypothetical protein
LLTKKRRFVPRIADPIFPTSPVAKPVVPVEAKKVEQKADMFASIFGAKPTVKKVVAPKPVVEAKGEYIFRHITCFFFPQHYFSHNFFLLRHSCTLHSSHQAHPARRRTGCSEEARS